MTTRPASGRGSGNPPRLLVVEDDYSIREALDAALSAHGYRVQVEADGAAGTRTAATYRPDLAILDVRLPGRPDGYGVARTLRAGSDIPVLFLTAADSLIDRLEGFAAGADDYLVKPFAMEELLARVSVLLRRSGRQVSAVMQIGDLTIDEAARRVSRGGRPVKLTRKEHELLTMLGRHPGQVLSKEQILGSVWGPDAYDPNLVEAHVSTLRRKLEACGPRLLHTVRGLGYVLHA